MVSRGGGAVIDEQRFEHLAPDAVVTACRAYPFQPPFPYPTEHGGRRYGAEQGGLPCGEPIALFLFHSTNPSGIYGNRTKRPEHNT
jgi:hypothetical protein